MPFIFRTTGTIEEYGKALCPKCGKPMSEHGNSDPLRLTFPCGVTSEDLVKAGLLKQLQ
jgi:hypothetical protein